MKRCGCHLLCIALVLADASAHSWIREEDKDPCAEYQMLFPTIFEQLAPFFGGINQAQVDKANVYFQYQEGEPAPKNARRRFNDTAGRTLRPDDPDFPWTSHFFLKLVYTRGALHLPGGPLPSHTHGYSFQGSWYTSFLLVDLLNVTKNHGPFPDFEFFVTGGDFQRVSSLSDDNTTFPVFGASGSKRYYDLVLPESASTVFYMPPANNTMDWADRKNVVVGRYNHMCHRGGSSLQWRGPAEKHPCVRKGFHEVSKSERNQQGLVDVGIFAFIEDPKPWLDPEYLGSAKYRLVLDGATIANRLPGLFRDSGQVILLEDNSPMFSYFYAALIPWVHYVPVGRDSYEDIFDVVKYLIKNDDLAQKIAKQGQEFGRKYLHPHASECYTKVMLEELSSLFTYKPRPLGPKAISLHDALELIEKDNTWMNENPEPWEAEEAHEEG